MNILAVDTATEACSAALLIDGALHQTFRLAPREHNRIILPMILGLLEATEIQFSMLDAIAFGCGPGSFTGIRIATGVVQGLSLGLDLPLVPVSTLAAMAHEAFLESSATRAHVSIDARMGEVYWGTYERKDDGSVSLIGDERVIAPELVRADCQRSDVGIGSGWMTYRETLDHQLGNTGLLILENRFPRASSIARLGELAFLEGVAYRPEDVEPVYLRNDVAKKPSRPR